MRKGAISLPGGEYATENEALSALTREAGRRGISYGQLVTSTTEWERSEIIRDYCREKRQERKKG